MGKRMSRNASASDFKATATADTITTTTVSNTTIVLADTAAIDHVIPTANDIVSAATKENIKKHLKSLDDAVKTFKKGFLAIGFNLLWFKETLAYQEVDGKEYKNIESFAKERYDISRSTALGYIQIAERFGRVNPKTGEIDCLKDEYKDFTATALMVMCTLDDETLAKCNPNMRVKDIKAIAVAKDEDDDENGDDGDGTNGKSSGDDGGDSSNGGDGENGGINSDDTRLSGVCLLHINTVEELENRKEYIFAVMKKVLTQQTTVNYSVGILQLEPPELAKV